MDGDGELRRAFVRGFETGDYGRVSNWLSRRSLKLKVLGSIADSCDFDFLFRLCRFSEVEGSFVFGHVIAKGRVDIVDYLFATGRIDVNYQFNEEGTTALMQACLYDQRDIVERLLNYGADPEQTGSLDQNAFFQAVMSKDVNIFYLLFFRTGRIDYVDSRGCNLLQHMCSWRLKPCHKIFEAILSLNVLDVNAQDKYGNTALHMLARWHDPVPPWEYQILALLKHPEINLTIENYKKETVYDLCRSKFAASQSIQDALEEALRSKKS